MYFAVEKKKNKKKKKKKNIYNKKLSNHFMRLTDQKNFERCAQIGHAESAEPSL